MKHNALSLKLFGEIEVGSFHFCQHLIRFLSEEVEWSNREIALRIGLSKDCVNSFLAEKVFEVKSATYEKIMEYGRRIIEENAIFEKVEKCSLDQ